ncbi:MAG: hypothetical protein IJU45_01170 [Clostridia bacterium]|nr:hypothetical protein [Clostridia bacterium]
MKSKKAFPFMNLFIGAAASLILLVPLRVFQYLTNIEPGTGFYSKLDFSAYAVYALMLFCVVFSFIISFAGRKNIAVKRVVDAPKLNACAFLLGGVGFASDAISSIAKYLSIQTGYSFNPSQSLYQYLSQEGGIIVLLQGIFAVLSAVYFGILAGAAFSNNDTAPKFRLMSLSGALWAVMKLLMMFKTKISFINVSDLFIELFACAFTMLFLFYFAVSLSQVDKGESYYKLYAYGIPAAVFTLVCFIPRAVLAVIGKSDFICEGHGISFSELMIAASILTALIARSYIFTKNSKEQ